MSSAKAIEGRTTPLGQCRDRASERRPAALHERAYDQGRRAHTFHGGRQLYERSRSQYRCVLRLPAYLTRKCIARQFASFLGDTGLQAPDVLNPPQGPSEVEWSIVHKQEWEMKYLAFASLAVFVMLTSITDASAVVCARGVYRAGCAGPRGAVVAHRGPYGRVYARGVRY